MGAILISPEGVRKTWVFWIKQGRACFKHALPCQMVSASTQAY